MADDTDHQDEHSDVEDVDDESFPSPPTTEREDNEDPEAVPPATTKKGHISRKSTVDLEQTLNETLSKLATARRTEQTSRKKSHSVKGFDLVNQIEFMSKTLEDREKELVKAVEIGQKLLEKNRELTRTVEDLTNALPPQNFLTTNGELTPNSTKQHSAEIAAMEMQIEELETKAFKLENRILDLESENNALHSVVSKLRSERNQLKTMNTQF